MRITLSALLLAIAQLASAQDWAKQAVEHSPRHRDWVTVKSCARNVSAYVAYPESKSKATAIVVIQEICGMSGWVKRVTTNSAPSGSIATAPALLSGVSGSPHKIAIEKPTRVLPLYHISAYLISVSEFVAKLP